MLLYIKDYSAVPRNSVLGIEAAEDRLSHRMTLLFGNRKVYQPGTFPNHTIPYNILIRAFKGLNKALQTRTKGLLYSKRIAWQPYRYVLHRQI